MGVMRLGHEQRVAAIDRIDIEEGDGLGRFEYLGRGDRAVDDLAEDAVRIVRSMAHDGASRVGSRPHPTMTEPISSPG